MLQEESRKALLIAETHASRELMLRRDIHAEQSRFSEQRQSLLKAEGTVRALSMRLQDLEKDQGQSAGMIEALKQRCSDLSAQLEEERRQRYPITSLQYYCCRSKSCAKGMRKKGKLILQQSQIKTRVEGSSRRMQPCWRERLACFSAPYAKYASKM